MHLSEALDPKTTAHNPERGRVVTLQSDGRKTYVLLKGGGGPASHLLNLTGGNPRRGGSSGGPNTEAMTLVNNLVAARPY